MEWGPSVNLDRRRVRLCWLLGALLATAALLGPLIGVASVMNWSETWREALSASGWVGVPLLLVVCSAAIGFALLPSFLMAICIPYLLPFDSDLLSLSLVALSLCFGTALGTGLGRLLFTVFPLWRDYLNSEKPRTVREKLSHLPRGQMATGLICLRISPHMPFALTNLVVGQLQVPLMWLAMVSVLGLLPRTLMGWAVGRKIESFALVEELSRVPLWGWLVSGLCVLGLIWVGRKAKSEWEEL